jgi:hypothetical protein
MEKRFNIILLKIAMRHNRDYILNLMWNQSKLSNGGIQTKIPLIIYKYFPIFIKKVKWIK